MAFELEGSVQAKRIYEYLTKVLGASDLSTYELLIDKSGNAVANKVSIADILAFATIGAAFYDSTFQILNATDNTKILKFLLSGISAGTTRTLTLLDEDGTLPLLESDSTEFEGQASGGYSVETFSATKTFDMNNGNGQEMTLTNNVISLTLSNKVNGGSYLIYLVQDTTGSRTIPTPDSTWGVRTDNSADFVTSANAVNLINVNVRPNGTTYYTIETYTP